MNIFRTLAVAFSALLRNATRSLLTMLGVIIGVGAVIAMVSIGEGAKAQVAEGFKAMGTSTLIVTAGSSGSGGVRGGAGSRLTITWDDLEKIRELPEIAAVSPQLRANSQAVTEEGNWQTTIYGVSPDWFIVRDWKVVSGESITDADISGRRAIALLGRTVVDNLFPSTPDPVGQTVRINGVPFTVTGVLDKKGTSGFGQDNDDQILIPYTTHQARISGGLAKFVSGQVMVSAADPNNTAGAKAAIEDTLRVAHKIKGDEEDDFNVRDMAEIVTARTESTNTITSLLAGVAVVSLIVGGIGIMNIMLVSVTERTREIGLRMAVGAKARNVLMQFLIEAVLLSVAGGILGMAAGIAAAKYMAGKLAVPFIVRPDIVAISVVVSAVVGVLFGLFPAKKASGLDPITALRYE
jgi:putative ABC transport system permease protein